jgi:6-phosphofructokinase
LDGLVVIGGDDSNTNACLLAENFRFVLSELYVSPIQEALLMKLRFCVIL